MKIAIQTQRLEGKGVGAYPGWLWLALLIFDLVCVVPPILVAGRGAQLTREQYAIRLGLLYVALFSVVYLVGVIYALFDLPPVASANPFLLQKIDPPSDAGFSMKVILLNVTASEITIDLSMLALIAAAIFIALVFAVIWWSVGRAKDAGWSKWWCLLWAAPLVNGIFLLGLLLRPSASVLRAQAAEREQSPVM